MDNNNPRLFSTCWLHVEVLGVNSITFYNLTKTLSLSEDLPVGAHVRSDIKIALTFLATKHFLIFTLNAISLSLSLIKDVFCGEFRIIDTVSSTNKALFVTAVSNKGCVTLASATYEISFSFFL